jgi:tRNA 2-thiocytidine biosynthesis protein TtcA
MTDVTTEFDLTTHDPQETATATGAGSGAVKSRAFLNLRRRLESATGKAIVDFGMISDGDIVMVCVSGGKDSYSLLSMLKALQSRAPVRFRLIAMNLDQRQPGFPAEVLPAHFRALGVDFRIVTADTYSIVRERIPVGRPACSLCSRLRRGLIYRAAKDLGATKIALGHHREDIVETFFLNLFHGGRLKAMPPKFLSDDGHHVVIRPLAYCAERDLARFARGMGYPIIPCNLCGTELNAERRQIKAMLEAWERASPGRVESIFRALSNVNPSHLADRALFDFGALRAELAAAVPDGATHPRWVKFSVVASGDTSC